MWFHSWHSGEVTSLFIITIISCLLLHRSISFEDRLSTLFQWLSLPQRERYLRFSIREKKSAKSDTSAFFFWLAVISDQTSSLCTWKSPTRQVTTTGREAKRSVILRTLRPADVSRVLTQTRRSHNNCGAVEAERTHSLLTFDPVAESKIPAMRPLSVWFVFVTSVWVYGHVLVRRYSECRLF